MDLKTERIKFWFTDKELKKIDRNAQKLKMNRSEYIRKLIADCRIIRNPQIDYGEYYKKFKEYGDAFDKQMIYLNTYGRFNEKMCNELSENMIALSEILLAEVSEKLKIEIQKAREVN